MENILVEKRKIINSEIDEFIVERLIYLFSTGILELSHEKPDVRIHKYPEYALKDCDNIQFAQNWWLKFKGEDKYFKLQEKLKASQELNREMLEVVEYYSEGMAHCDYDHYNLNMKDGYITVASGKRARQFLTKYEDEIGGGE